MTVRKLNAAIREASYCAYVVGTPYGMPHNVKVAYFVMQKGHLRFVNVLGDARNVIEPLTLIDGRTGRTIATN